MRIFGLDITRSEKALNSVSSGNGGWWPIVRESFGGAWQRNITLNHSEVTANHAVFSCATLIAHDLAKLRCRLVRLDPGSRVWQEVESPAYSPVLRRPNGWQNPVQFWEQWFLSKLLRGSTYVLKRRDNRNVVTDLYVLDPGRVRPLVSDSGAIFYEIEADNLAGIPEQIIAPAREIIHDRWNCLFHPLVGVSPVYACALAATQGLRIQETSVRLFQNDARPGGILTAPSRINDDTAKRLKEHWEQNFSGENRGRVAVLGDGLKYESMAISPADAQAIEQLRWSAEVVCSTFKVPPYMISVGNVPAHNHVQALTLQYYSKCLQIHAEAAERCLDDGLECPPGTGTEFELDALLRMDALAQAELVAKLVGSGVMAPDEGRRRFDLPPTEGGAGPYLQHQNYSLAALARRDAMPNPFDPRSPDGGDEQQPKRLPAPEGDAAAQAPDTESEARAALVEIYKGLAA
jgi:HK97 family phage portal protein